MDKVLLIHGFNKDKRDMEPLEKFLYRFGYECFIPDFPLTYREFDHSGEMLESYVEEVIRCHLEEDEKIHLVGHSTGGLVIRKFLTHTKWLGKIGRCVLIATPNNGSKLAEFASRIKGFTNIYKTLHSISYHYIHNQLLSHPANIEIGAIAGNQSNLLLGKLIEEANDGRVELSSVFFKELKDFTVLPYGHKDIHHQEETAQKIHTFIQTGKF